MLAPLKQNDFEAGMQLTLTRLCSFVLCAFKSPIPFFEKKPQVVAARLLPHGSSPLYTKVLPQRLNSDALRPGAAPTTRPPWGGGGAPAA